MSTSVRTAVIDADTHVLETERTWDFMDEADARFKPFVLLRKDGTTTEEWWFLEGRAFGKNSNQGDQFPTAAREATDIAQRVAHMDELGVDVHVLYPTFFLRPASPHADTQIALAKCYNRWMADVWKRGEGRLRWAVIPPLLVLDKAIE